MTSAIAPAIASALTAFGNQSRSGGSQRTRPTIESALPVLSATDKKKLKKLQAEADKERIYNLLSQPEVLGLVITLGGIFASNRVSFASDRERNLALQSVATTASVLLGLGYAGVGDLTTLIIALGAGGGSILGGLIDLPGISDVGQAGTSLLGTLDPTKWQNWVPGYNLYEWLK